jgi:hypothetical protein
MTNFQPSRLFVSLFVLCWLFIIFVSVFDGFLALRYRHELHRTELNPVGRWLILLNDNHVWLLLGAKFMGTVAVATAVLLIHSRWPRLGLAIATALACLQLFLLLFLLLA